MEAFRQWRSLSADQQKAFLAAYLGWMLDAFDFFLLVFVIKDVAAEFHADHTEVARAIGLTLACRPIGAFLFGLAADRYGRRVPLMIDVVLYSLLEVLSGFAPSLASFLVLRALFGVAMGGEWGLGASLALESAPAEARGVLSGILQQGYPAGYLLAAIIYRFVLPGLGWRWLFFIGGAPALLSLFIRGQVKESPVWERAAHERLNWRIGTAIRQNARRFAYLVLLMTAFNFMSHGTQDMYPTFLQVQHRFSPETVSNIAITYNIGALIGGALVGGLSQQIGRRKAIVIAALLALPVVPLWAFSHTPAMLALGAFLMQFFVQGAWGVIPAHLTELSPNAVRGTFTGFAYQLGNLFASYNASLQTGLAKRHGENYAYALSTVVAVVLAVVVIVTAVGPEARGVEFDRADE
jgi:SHS family lactate transporter-like MFS transporter